jgi:hypothetical protein
MPILRIVQLGILVRFSAGAGTFTFSAALRPTQLLVQLATRVISFGGRATIGRPTAGLVQCRGYECMDLRLHSPMYLHGLVVNWWG